jgi:tRNA G46 methylase TrmB
MDRNTAGSVSALANRAQRWFLLRLLCLLQRTPFRGDNRYALASRTENGTTDSFPQARQELFRIDDFFQYFRDQFPADAIRGKTVLDFGCGYGGRSVGYVTQYGAAEVVGVEVYPVMVARCTEFARQLRVQNV